MSQGPKQGPPSYPRSLTPTSVAVDKGSLPIPLYAQSTHPASGLPLADHVLPPHRQSRSRAERAWAWSASFVRDNRGSLFVLLSQFFGSTMSLCTRVLETSLPEQKMHAMQILFIRQSVTTVIVGILIFFRSVEHAPWGPRGVRWLLVGRGFGGFFGVFGLYCSSRFSPFPVLSFVGYTALMAVEYRRFTGISRPLGCDSNHLLSAHRNCLRLLTDPLPE